jgi:hypothetical protein
LKRAEARAPSAVRRTKNGYSFTETALKLRMNADKRHPPKPLAREPAGTGRVNPVAVETPWESAFICGSIAASGSMDIFCHLLERICHSMKNC